MPRKHKNNRSIPHEKICNTLENIHQNVIIFEAQSGKIFERLSQEKLHELFLLQKKITDTKEKYININNLLQDVRKNVKTVCSDVDQTLLQNDTKNNCNILHEIENLQNQLVKIFSEHKKQSREIFRCIKTSLTKTYQVLQEKIVFQHTFNTLQQKEKRKEISFQEIKKRRDIQDKRNIENNKKPFRTILEEINVYATPQEQDALQFYLAESISADFLNTFTLNHDLPMRITDFSQAEALVKSQYLQHLYELRIVVDANIGNELVSLRESKEKETNQKNIYKLKINHIISLLKKAEKIYKNTHYGEIFCFLKQVVLESIQFYLHTTTVVFFKKNNEQFRTRKNFYKHICTFPNISTSEVPYNDVLSEDIQFIKKLLPQISPINIGKSQALSQSKRSAHEAIQIHVNNHYKEISSEKISLQNIVEQKYYELSKYFEKKRSQILDHGLFESFSRYCFQNNLNSQKPISIEGITEHRVAFQKFLTQSGKNKSVHALLEYLSYGYSQEFLHDCKEKLKRYKNCLKKHKVFENVSYEDFLIYDLLPIVICEQQGREIADILDEVLIPHIQHTKIIDGIEFVFDIQQSEFIETKTANDVTDKSLLEVEIQCTLSTKEKYTLAFEVTRYKGLGLQNTFARRFLTEIAESIEDDEDKYQLQALRLMEEIHSTILMVAEEQKNIQEEESLALAQKMRENKKQNIHPTSWKNIPHTTLYIVPLSRQEKSPYALSTLSRDASLKKLQELQLPATTLNENETLYDALSHAKKVKTVQEITDLQTDFFVQNNCKNIETNFDLSKVQRFICSLPQKTQKKLYELLAKLERNSYEIPDTKKLQAHKNTYRIRMGKIRIIYTHTHGEITIQDIDYRGNVYS